MNKEEKFEEFERLKFSILEQVNLARTNPQNYAEILKRDKEYFKENILHRPDEDPLNTQEGELAHIEAIKFLENLKPLNELKLSELLSLACKDHVEDIGKSGALSHEGSNKETISSRVETYAEWDYFLSQNIDFGGKTSNEIIIQFITGDGDPTRTHRKNLFREDINFIGIDIGPHKETEICTVIAFAGNIRELGSIAPEIQNFISNHIKKVEQDKSNPKPKSIKTKFQIEDPDAPSNAISYTTYKKMKLVNGRAKHCTQRVYTLTDGTQYIVEVFDDLKVRCDTSIKN